jgi:hypothetical protein
MGLARFEELEAELLARGLEASEASAFVAALISAYPMTRRLGYVEVARRLHARGLEMPAALETGAMLLALELLSGGWTFPEALEQLLALKLEVGVARTAAMEAARIQRAVSKPDTGPRTGLLRSGTFARLFRR